MDARLGFYAFILGLVNMIWTARYIVGPFILMALIIRLVRWSWATARGERDYDDMQQEYRDLLEGWQTGSFQARYDANRQYRTLRGMGFTPRQISRYRNPNQSGKTFRIKHSR